MSIFSYMYMVPDSSVGRSPNLLYEYLHEETDIIHGPLPETIQTSMHHSVLETHAIFVHVFLVVFPATGFEVPH